MEIKGLSPEKIRELRAKKKGSKGVYEEKLFFLLNDSDEPGVDVVESWPEAFTQINAETGKREPKLANTLYQGFVKAAEKLEVADQVDIMNREGHVFILVMSRLEEQGILDEATAATNGNGAHSDETAEADATTEA